MASGKRTSALTQALIETAGDMYDEGLIDKATHQKITVRHLGAEGVPPPKPLTSAQIRGIREKAHMSQAVFARHLNLTAGYVSQLERGTKRPTGAALALLNIMQRKGVQALID